MTPAALQLSPKGEGETTQEATPSPRAPRPGRGRGNQREPQVVSLFFLQYLALSGRRSPARPGPAEGAAAGPTPTLFATSYLCERIGDLRCKNE